MAVIATVAGAEPPVALRLGVSMTALQASIGAVNDLVDAPRDAGYKPGKPLPAGLVSARMARLLAAAGGGLGVALAVPSGLGLVALAAVVLAVGYGYDLAFKGTAWSWLPFAIGIPLLPVYGWLGATGSMPPYAAILLPAAVLAGTALAIANARADLDRDVAAGTDSVAVRLGSERAWVVQTALLAIVAVAALGTLAIAGAPGVAVAAAGASVGVVALGVILGRGHDADGLERAWRVLAIGVAILAAAWLGGMGLGQ